MAKAVWFVLAASRVSWAEPLEIRTKSELVETGPKLHLDPILRTRLEGLGTVEERKTTTLQIGPIEATLEGARFAIDDRKAEPTIDLPVRGWRTSLRLSHDFGFVRLEASLSRNHVDMHHGRGTYRERGVSLSRTFRLSRWMRAVVGLDIGQRAWEGDQPPAGEANETTVMLRVGTTFR